MREILESERKRESAGMIKEKERQRHFYNSLRCNWLSKKTEMIVTFLSVPFLDGPFQ